MKSYANQSEIWEKGHVELLLLPLSLCWWETGEALAPLHVANRTAVFGSRLTPSQLPQRTDRRTDGHMHDERAFENSVQWNRWPKLIHRWLISSSAKLSSAAWCAHCTAPCSALLPTSCTLLSSVVCGCIHCSAVFNSAEYRNMWRHTLPKIAEIYLM